MSDDKTEASGMAESAVPLKIRIRTTAAHRYLRWKRARILVVAGGVVAMAALASAGYLRGEEEPAVAEARASASPPAPASPPEGQRLRRIDLGVRLPDGWRELGEAEREQLAGPKDSIVLLRGATPADSTHGMFVAATAAHADPIAAARDAERGVIRQLGIDASAYHAAGCALVELRSGPAARCSGVAEHATAHVAVEIFVRSVGKRDIVALSLAPVSQPAAGAAGSASAEAAAIVASFTP